MLSYRILAGLVPAFFIIVSHASDDAIAAIAIKSLANSCMSCHGVNTLSDSKMPGIAGLDQSYFVNRMIELRKPDQPHDVRAAHVTNVTEQEITDLASFFAQQSRACPFYQKHPVKQFTEK